MTRNYDYIYIGGAKYTTANTNREVIFYKFDSHGDYGIATSLLPANDDLTLVH